MSNLIVTSPQRPYTFPDKFKAVSNGDVYAGLVDKTDLENPANQIQVYVVGEDGSETPVEQPLKINSGGLLVYNGQPAKFVVKQNYSMLVKQRGKQVFYEANMAFVDPESLIKVVEDYIKNNTDFVFSGFDDLRAYTPDHAGQSASIKTLPGAKWIAVDSDPGNTVAINQPAQGGFWWKLQIDGRLNIKHCDIKTESENPGQDYAAKFQEIADSNIAAYIPSANGSYYRILSPIYFRDFNDWIGDGKSSVIKNDKTNQSPYSSQFCAFIGNIDSSGYTDARNYGIENVPRGSGFVQLQNVNAASNFKAGDVVAFYGAETVQISNLNKPVFQYQTSLRGVDLTLGRLILDDPFQEALVSSQASVANLSENTGISDNLGNPAKAVKNVNLSNIAFIAETEKWIGFGGAHRCKIENIYSESDYLLSCNGWSFCEINSLHGKFHRGGIELAYFSCDTIVNNPEGYHSGKSASNYDPGYATTELARRIECNSPRFYGHGIWNADYLYALSLGIENSITNARGFIDNPNLALLDISADNGVAYGNKVINANIGCNSANFAYRITEINGTGKVYENEVRNNKFYGNFTADGGRVQGTNNKIYENYTDTKGITVDSNAERNQIRLNTSGNEDAKVSDSGESTTMYRNFTDLKDIPLVGSKRTFQLDDDKAISIDLVNATGFAKCFTTVQPANYIDAFYNYSSPAIDSVNKGAGWETTTGPLNGTSGTNGKLTMSVDNSGKIFIENRIGATQTFTLTLQE